MEKKDKQKICVVFLAVLLIAVGLDLTQEKLGADGVLLRNETGADEKEIPLILDMEGVDSSYEYLLELKPVQVTKEQAEAYFAGAVLEIDKDFLDRKEKIPQKESYQGGLVEAEWAFDPWGVINADGSITWEEVPKEGLLVMATATLTCGRYEQLYQFPLELTPKELSEAEQVLAALDTWAEEENAKEGESRVELPKELAGVNLNWSQKTESLSLKILLLEGVAVFLIWFLQKKNRQQEQKKLEESMERDYPDIVEQLALLLGAGMTLRQAFGKMAARYLDKRKKGMISEKAVYERLVRMHRRLSEGENERVAYRQFAEETRLMCYHRLIRILLGNLEKGSQGICEFLEQESRQAYEQRITQAKKLGEEASTRMLLPLMLMMLIVMAVVTVPAIISFSM